MILIVFVNLAVCHSVVMGLYACFLILFMWHEVNATVKSELWTFFVYFCVRKYLYMHVVHHKLEKIDA